MLTVFVVQNNNCEGIDMGDRSKQYNNEENKNNILIVDDDLLVRQSLRKVIDQETNFTVCAEADDTPQALDAIDKQKVDFVIVNISMKGTKGVEVSKKIQSQHPNLYVLTIPICEFLKE